MSHTDEVITDVHKRRVMARARSGCFTIAWDYPGRTLLEVRILRSSHGFAETADDGPVAAQELVYQDVTGSFRDVTPDAGPYCYTVFARHPGGTWVRWGEYSAGEPAPGHERRGLRRLFRGSRKKPAVILLILAAITLSFAGLTGPQPAAASGDEEGGGSAGSAASQSAGGAAAAAAEAVVQADSSIAAVLAGKDATVDAASWGGAEGDPAGTTLTYRWAAASATVISEQWPLLRSGDGTPVAPYDSSAYRIRASEVSALRVDVLADGARILQVVPIDGETRFTLEEQTWAPFSWLPWFTARPWVLAPVFLGIAVLLMASAWRRSRAWNRRLPSMTRHDRQFIARVAILLFLLVGFAWQFYEGWYAATGPSVGSSTTSAGSLATLPLLLIPPGLFVAGLILELSSAPRRGSWALLAVLCGAASGYFLAGAMTGATTNLNLSYYILLAVLALISIPRAFSAGKMGWSRSAAPRYG